MAISSASLIKPRKRLVLKDKDKDNLSLSASNSFVSTTSSMISEDPLRSSIRDEETTSRPIRHVEFALRKEPNKHGNAAGE